MRNFIIYHRIPERTFNIRVHNPVFLRCTAFCTVFPYLIAFLFYLCGICFTGIFVYDLFFIDKFNQFWVLERNNNILMECKGCLLKKDKARYIDNNKSIANNKTIESQKLLESMETILDHALSINYNINFDSLRNNDEFPVPKPKKASEPIKPTYQNVPPEPNNEFPVPKPEKAPGLVEPTYQYNIPPEPNPNDEKYKPQFGIFDFSKKRESIKREALEKFEEDKRFWENKKQEIINNNQKLKLKYESELKEHENTYQKKLGEWEIKKEMFNEAKRLAWENKKQEIIDNNQKLKLKYELELKEIEDTHRKNLDEWMEKRQEFLDEQETLNNSIKENYLKCSPDEVHHYSKHVLSNSKYHEDFPQEFEVEYNPENKILIIDYQLPSINDIPTLKEVKYIQSRDEFTEKHITKTQLNKLYDKILYQIALRTIHELYESHHEDILEAIVFNGLVSSIDPATGKEVNACVLSVQANKEDFREINLEMVEPKACFKKLKGVGSSKLHSLTPIPPVVKMNREDSRFTESYGVVDNINEGYNLAVMDWEDFENLIREVFEQAFADSGAEVKVTQASRDGGIDAVIFDPDPLRGGKIVVQAKRYTNVVGVSAVRDLYGTLLNEGANKGILVTTSDYGPDAYNFANDKPIQLLNGSNLLHLLEQYGHKARIDLQEAKTILNQEKD